MIEICKEELSTNSLTINLLKTRIRTKYCQLLCKSKNSEENVALMMQQQFKGSCNVCRKIGHKRADCFTLAKNKDKKKAFFKRLEERKEKGKS